MVNETCSDLSLPIKLCCMNLCHEVCGVSDCALHFSIPYISLHSLRVMVGSLLHSGGPEGVSQLHNHSVVELLLYAYKYINVWKTTAVCCKLSLAHVVGPEIEAYLILPILPELRLPSQLRLPLGHIFSTSQLMQLSHETNNLIFTSLRSFFRYPMSRNKSRRQPMRCCLLGPDFLVEAWQRLSF